MSASALTGAICRDGAMQLRVFSIGHIDSSERLVVARCLEGIVSAFSGSASFSKLIE
jgi:hypothetical protein